MKQRHTRPYFVAIVVCAVAVIASGCRTKPLKLPQWPAGALPTPQAAPQVNSPCQDAAKAPKPKRITIKGQIYYQVHQDRARCLVARAKIGQGCRHACDKRVATYRQAVAHIADTILVVGADRERKLHAHYKRELAKTALVSASVSVAVVAAIATVVIVALK